MGALLNFFVTIIAAPIILLGVIGVSSYYKKNGGMSTILWLSSIIPFVMGVKCMFFGAVCMVKHTQDVPAWGECLRYGVIAILLITFSRICGMRHGYKNGKYVQSEDEEES